MYPIFFLLIFFLSSLPLFSADRVNVIPIDPNGRPVSVVYDNEGNAIVITEDGRITISNRHFDVGGSTVYVHLDSPGEEYFAQQGKTYLDYTIEFKGRATELFLKCYGKQANWTGNWIKNAVTTPLFNREAVNIEFRVPLSSPSVIVLDLADKTTVYWYIGGLRRR